MGELAIDYAGSVKTPGNRPVELTDIECRLFSSSR